jgi:hypothetical protein
MAANVPQPSFVDIIVPKCPPGMESVGSQTRMQLIMSGTACVDTNGCKNKPCGATCYDIKAPNTGYTCSDCPYGFGLPTGSTSKKPNAQCMLNGKSVPCLTGKGSAGPTCVDVNDCAKTATGPPAGPCSWNGIKCTDVSASNPKQPGAAVLVLVQARL